MHDTRFSTLLDQLEAGHPVLVFQNLGFGFYPVWHYAVVIGYDLDDKVITLHSGTTAGLERDFRRFELEWRGGDYWAMTLHQPGEFPANADASVYLEATVGLEQAEQFAAAARAYQGRQNAGQTSSSVGWDLAIRTIACSSSNTLNRLISGHSPLNPTVRPRTTI